jgi:hypothetical protein
MIVVYNSWLDYLFQKIDVNKTNSCLELKAGNELYCAKFHFCQLNVSPYFLI